MICLDAHKGMCNDKECTNSCKVFNHIAEAQEAERAQVADIDLTHSDIMALHMVLLKRVREDKKNRLSCMQHDELLKKLEEYLNG